jgi:hypothetical protein
VRGNVVIRLSIRKPARLVIPVLPIRDCEPTAFQLGASPNFHGIGIRYRLRWVVLRKNA